MDTKNNRKLWIPVPWIPPKKGSYICWSVLNGDEVISFISFNDNSIQEGEQLWYRYLV